MDRFFLFDIETIRDEPIMSRFPTKTQSATIPPPIANQVVAISYVAGCMEDAGRSARISIEQCSSLGDALSSEAGLLEGFWDLVAATTPVLVTWNGRCFDVPVLLHRSLISGISAQPWFGFGGINRYRNYGYRYGDRHIDLMDVMSDYGAVRSYGLDLIAELLGLPGKIGGHGSEVAGMYAKGELSKIRAYCECDCLNLYGVFLHWSVLTGRIDRRGYVASEAHFKDFLQQESFSKAHIKHFRDAWEDRVPIGGSLLVEA